jgi:hypothetical protein
MSEKTISINTILEKLNTIIDVDRVYPRENSPKVSIDDLKAIGIRLTQKQALELAAYLTLAVSDGWEVIDITGFRKIKKNGKYKITITSKL